jgi:quercetin dioxygenase-like cupin family protein
VQLFWQPVKKNVNHLQELAALHALGALEGEDERTFLALLETDAKARAELGSFRSVTEALARSLPSRTPSSGLRERILGEAQRRSAESQAVANIKKLVPNSRAGLAFLKEAGAAGWLPLPVPGAAVKLLSFDDASGYAVVLGKLEAGSRYPSHTHRHPEDIYMLSGDLHVGDEIIRAGDFHHADAGSRHGVNWSETGCVLLCVLSKEDLLAQLVPS